MMMAVSWFILAFARRIRQLQDVSTGTMVDGTARTRLREKKPFDMKTLPGMVGVVLAVLLIPYFAMGSLIDFVGSVALFGSLVMLTSGFGDTRYVAKKFAAYHFFALVTCACANIFDGSSADPSVPLILRIFAFGIVIAAYPLGGWIDSFFSRGTARCLSTWLILVRPILVAFFAETIAQATGNSFGRQTTAVPLVLAWLSMGFAPILFFAKTELRKLIAAVATWCGGPIFLFAVHLPPGSLGLLTLFAITQGIFLTIISDGATYLWQENGNDSIENLHGLLQKNYFMAIPIMSSLFFLIAMPLIFIFKRGVPQLPNSLVYQILAGMPLPVIFAIKIYGLMKKSSAEGNGSRPVAKDKMAVFLDRDGTIIVDKNYLRNPKGVELLEGAREAIGKLKSFGCRLFLFSNQSGVARGLLTVDDVRACNRRMVELLGCVDGVFEGICMATELPSDNPVYRKPSPKFIVEMIEKYDLSPGNCYMVGDKESDVLAAMNAKINPVLIGENFESNASFSSNSGGMVFPSILTFSNWLISSSGEPPPQHPKGDT